MEEGYNKASVEYGKKLQKQAGEFLKQKELLKKESTNKDKIIEKQNKILDELNEYINYLESQDTLSANQRNELRDLVVIREKIIES